MELLRMLRGRCQLLKGSSPLAVHRGFHWKGRDKITVVIRFRPHVLYGRGLIFLVAQSLEIPFSLRG